MGTGAEAVILRNMLTFQAAGVWSFRFGPAFADDFQICRHHQGFGRFNPDVADTSQVLVNRRAGQSAMVATRFLPQFVARHPVIVERFQDGLSHRAELSPRQIA